MDRTKKSAKNSIFSVLLQLSTILSGFVTKTAIVKYLGIEYGGISSLFTDILAILALTELGFDAAAGYALYRPIHDNDENHIMALMNYYKKFYLIITILILLFGAICTPFILFLIKGTPDIKENIYLIFYLYILQTAGSYVLIYKSIFLKANQEENIVCKASIISIVFFTIIEIIAIVKTKNFIFFLILVVISTIIKNIIISVAANIRFPFLKKKCTRVINDDERKTLKRNIGALAIYKICYTVQRSIDSVVVSAMMGVASVGYMSNYRMLSSGVETLFGKIVEATKPSVGNLAVSEDGDYQHQIFKKLCMLSFIIGNYISTSLFVLLNPFVEIWLGNDYILGMGIVATLVADVYILTMVRPYENFRIANELFIEGRYRPIIMVIINIILSVALCKSLGIFGVLLATVIARLSTISWYDPWLINKRVFHKSFRKYIAVKTAAAFVVCISCALTYWISCFINSGNVYLDFVIKMLLCFISSGAISFAVVFKTREFKDLICSFRGILKR